MQSYQGANTARRADEVEVNKSQTMQKTEGLINPSENTLATFRGVDKETLDNGKLPKMCDDWKGHEKRKIIQKFLAKDEIFFKILQLIPTSISENYKRLEDRPLSSSAYKTTRENERYFRSNGGDEFSPRESFQTTNNTNINFYITNNTGDLSERD